MRVTKEFPAFKAIDFKWSDGIGEDFPRIEIRVRDEIVTFGVPEEIKVDKKDKSVKSWKVWDKNGKRTVFRVDKFMANAPADDKIFTFDKKKYPGVEVVDLR